MFCPACGGLPVHQTMRPRLLLSVLTLFAAKTCVTTLFRVIYPFSSEFAASLSVSEETYFIIVSFGELAGAFSPLLGASSSMYSDDLFCLHNCLAEFFFVEEIVQKSMAFSFAPSSLRCEPQKGMF